MSFLNDTQFLKKLDTLRIKEQYIRLTVLSWKEEPIIEIQGKAISGSLNLNGDSSLRRTANFTMFAEARENDLTNIDQELSINRKVRLEIGIVNTVPSYYYSTINKDTNEPQQHEINYQQRYGKMIWLPLGMYVIFDPQISHEIGSVTISLSLKDKMCLLNGDAGGTFPAAVTLSEVQNQKGEITHPTMAQIIYQVVTHFGAEDPAKVIIQDLDNRVRAVMKYIGNSPLYYYQHGQSRNFYLNRNEAIAAAQATGAINPDSAVIMYQQNQDVGYTLTDFIYPGDLNCAAGDTITKALDSIIEALGNYEYFYDVNGFFRFRQIKNYLNTTYTTEVLNQINTNPTYEVDFSHGASVYTFDGTQLITSIQNAPKYSNVKNDFVVWGVRKAADGETQIPVRYHLAIDTKPQIGHKHYVTYYTDEFGVIRAAAQFTRAVDKLPAQGHEDTIYQVGDLRDPIYYKWDASKNQFYQITPAGTAVTTVDWREELYYQGVESLDLGTAQPYYFAQLINEWPKIFNLKTQKFNDSVRENPASVDFWLDLIDDSAKVGKYSVGSIGRRSMVVSEDKLNCVFEKDIPPLIFLNNTLSPEDLEKQRQECRDQGYDFIQVDDSIFSLLTMGGTQNSCYQRVTQLLYQYTNMNQTISFSAMPIYYLQPNTRITIRDDASGINGDYMIQSISLPLDVNSTMSIQAYKCQQKL